MFAHNIYIVFLKYTAGDCFSCDSKLQMNDEKQQLT